MLSLLKALSFLLGRMPMSIASLLGRIVGAVGYRFLKRHRNIALSNLDLAFGDSISNSERERITKAVFRNLATMFFEFTRIPWMERADVERLVKFSGLENFDKALAKGKGAILLTGHFGNWELLGSSLGQMGYKLDIVVRMLDHPVFEEFVSWTRTSSGNRIVYKNRAMRKLLKSLESNSIVAILVDQNVSAVEGFFVDFFGRSACTNKGPAHLALVSGAAVVPAFIMREGGGHRVVVLEELEVINTGDREQDALVNTARFTRTVEEMIRRCPDEWFWVHRRWKTRPVKESGRSEGTLEGN